MRPASAAAEAAAEAQALRAWAETGRRARVEAHLARILAVMIIAIGALDCISTDLALGTGAAAEANPFVAALQSAVGPYWVWPKMLIHGLLAASLVAAPSRLALAAMGAVTLLTLLAAANNLAIYHTVLVLRG